MKMQDAKCGTLNASAPNFQVFWFFAGSSNFGEQRSALSVKQ